MVACGEGHEIPWLSRTRFSLMLGSVTAAVFASELAGSDTRVLAQGSGEPEEPVGHDEPAVALGTQDAGLGDIEVPLRTAVEHDRVPRQLQQETRAVTHREHRQADKADSDCVTHGRHHT